MGIGAASRSKKVKIGELLILEGLLTHDQLKEILALQKKQNIYMPFGKLCISQKYISRADLQRVLRKYQKSISLGELLLNLGIIAQEQLQSALERQISSNKRIGRLLIEMGFINESTLVDVLSIQLGIPKIVPSISIIDKSLLDGLNPEFLQKYQFIPAFKEGDELTVIMVDPSDNETLRLLEKVLKCKIVPAIARADEIQKTISAYYQKLEIGQELQSRGGGSDLVIGDTDLFKNKHDNIIEILNFIISDAMLERATDIHMEPQDGLLRVRYRIDGMLHHKTDLPISLAPKLTSRIKALCNLDIAEKRRHQDGRIQARIINNEYDLRISTYAAIWGENVVIRLQNRRNSLIDINMLGFSPANQKKYLEILKNPAGIILVTGPTGSGKTTTLYASLQFLNGMERVIITIEDPVEYTIDGVIQASILPKIGVKYVDCLKSMMRQDPDVLMIGEIREPESAEAVVQAALTGHTVFSTFHTNDATGALLRLMDMGIESYLISSTLVSVVAQRLVRVLCKYCKESCKPSKDFLAFFSSLDTREIGKFQFFKPKGCIHCNYSGFKGMTAIQEVLMVNHAIRDEILQRSTSTRIREVARKNAALVTMSEDGFYKSIKGITSLQEVIRVVYRDDCDEFNPMTIDELIARCEVD